jgi:branched-chain amino acid transport system substrate-binding protein
MSADVLVRRGVTRRGFLTAAVSAVVAGVVAGVGAYYAGTLAAPVREVTKTETRTVTTTTTLPPAAPITTTVTKPVTTTVTETKTTTITAAPKPPRTIKIGTTCSLSGMYAAHMYKKYDFLKALQDEINKRGGVYVDEYGQYLPVEFVMYDDKSDPAVCEKMYTKLIVEDKVDVLISAYTYTLSSVATTVAEKYRVPIIDEDAAEVPLHQRGYKYFVGSMQTINLWLKPYLDMVKEDGRPSTVATLAWKDPFSEEVIGFAKEYSKYLGLTVVYHTVIPYGTTDYTPYISTLKALDPDIVMVCDITAVDTGSFWRQCRELGYAPRDFHAPYATNLAFREQLEPWMVEWVTSDVWYDDILPYTGWGGWMKKAHIAARKKAGFEPYTFPWVELLTSQVEPLLNAISMAGTLDKEAINEALHKQHFMCVEGPWYTTTPIVPDDEPELFSLPWKPMKLPDGRLARGENIVPALTTKVMQLQNGKWQMIWPKELRTAKWVYPAPFAKR